MSKTLPLMILSIFVLAYGIFAADTLYTETFANGSLQNTWYAGFNTSGVAPLIEPHMWSGNPSGDGWVGRLTTNRPDSGQVGENFSGTGTYTDFYLEAKFFLPIDPTFMGVEYYGLEFRVDSSGLSSGYQFLANFNSMTPRLRFRKRPSDSPATPVAIKDWMSSEIPGGIPSTSGWHKLAVKAVGNNFWFYFDDQELPGCPYSDTTSSPLFTQGFIGVYTFYLDFMGYDTTNLIVDDIYVISTSSAIEDPTPTVSQDFQLHQNFPNPFNPSTVIAFDIPRSSQVTIEVFDNLGQKVRQLVNRFYNAGHFQVTWDGKDDSGNDVPAGIYYYRMTAGKYQQTRKMLLVR